MAQSEPDGMAWPQIQADLRSLQQLTEQLSGEVSGRLRPAVLDVFDQYEAGGFTTGSPSVDLHAVHSRYADCLRETCDRLAKYVMESGRLVDAASVILTRYRTADELASATVDDVNAAFTAVDSRGRPGTVASD
jgi:hypothetical protein